MAKVPLRKPKKKVCAFCKDKATYIDYKDTALLRKFISTQEVAGLGSPGDVVEVRDGYARNYLIPRGYAMAWTRGGEKQVATIKRARDARGVRDLDHAKEIKTSLEKLSVRLSARAGSGGRLFGSVTAADVVSAVS